MDETSKDLVRTIVREEIDDAISESQTYYTRILDEAKERDARMLNLLRTQGEAMSTMSQNLKNLEKDVGEGQEQMRIILRNIIYALIGVITGILASIGYFQGSV